jgi:hypothetical protein
MLSARLLSCAALYVSFAFAAAPAPVPAQNLLRGLPLRFEANAGQWDSAVRYSARAGGGRLFLTGHEAVLAVDQASIGISFAGSDPAASLEGDGRLAAGVQYFRGSRDQWRTAPQFTRVRQRGVYPGIDVVYYGNGNQLEYDFVLAPQADPGRIRLNFRGAGLLSLTPAGDLAIEAGSASFLQKRPYIYQEVDGSRREIKGRYRLLASNAVGLELDPYDRSRALTIDPVLSYASLIGGGGSDGVTAVRVAPNGRVYVAGYIQNNDLQGNDASFAASGKGGSDGFLAILDPRKSGADSLLYFTYLGGSGNDRVNAIALDGIGNVYLAGSTASFDFPLAGNGVQQGMGGTDAADAFVTKLNPSLAGSEGLLYSTFIGGTLVDEANAVAVDARGMIYVAGTTRSDNFPLTPSAYAGVLYGAQDAFLVKINPDSSSPLLYSTYFGAEKTDWGNALAVTPSGIVYLAGTTTGSELPQAGAMYRFESAGANDIFLTRWNLDRSNVASLDYSTYIGGSGVDEVRAIALDSAGRVLLTGYTLSNDFPTTGNAYRRNNMGNGDVFVVRFDVDAQRAQALNYSTYFGGSGGDVAYGIVPGEGQTVWLTGYTLSPNLPVTAAALQSAPAGGVEVFLANLDLSKSGGESLAYSSYLGDVGVNVGYAIAAGADGSVYIGGQSAARKVPTTASGFQIDFAGGLTDGFVLVLGR